MCNTCNVRRRHSGASTATRAKLQSLDSMSARDRLLQSLDMKKLACMKLAKENPNQTFFEVDFSPCEHFRWHKLTSYSMLRSFVAIAIDGASLLPCAALTVPLAQLRSSAADGARGQRGNRGALRTVSRVAVPRATRHRGPNQVVAPTLFSASTRQSHIFARIHCEGSDSQGSCAWATVYYNWLPVHGRPITSCLCPGDCIL